MSKILISGANGLLGKKVTDKLVKEGHQVYSLTKVTPKNPINGAQYIPVDLSTNWSFNVLPQKIDKIIHLAQSSNFRDFPNNALDVFKVNIESTARLLDYAHKIGAQQFIYASSGGVYGNSSQAFKENAPIVPLGKLGYYLGSKTCGEILVQSYASVFQVVVIRPFFMYGPGQNRSMLIPRLFDSVKLGKSVSLQGKNGIRINPIHVEDASEAVTASLSLNESSTFNIAGPEVLSLREICESMGKFLGKEPVFINQPGDPNDLIADISAMRNKLVSPQILLSESLVELDSQASER
jgi:UDP-glucose 4-epimerase